MKRFIIAVLLASLAIPAAAAPPKGGTATIEIDNFMYKPDALTVNAGDTVVFTNDDQVLHNVTGSGLVSGDIAGGASWKHTFTDPGTYAYVCGYHPWMKGTITVTARTPSM